MNAKRLSSLLGRNDGTLEKMCKAWETKGSNTPVAESLRAEQRGERLRWRCFRLFVFGAFFGAIRPLHPAFLGDSFTVGMIWCLGLCFVPLTVSILVAKGGFDTLLHTLDPWSSVGRFLEVVTILETRLGELSEDNENWSSSELLQKAGRRSAFGVFERIMDLEDARDPRLNAKRGHADKVFKGLVCLTGIPPNVGPYFSRLAIEAEKGAERFERDAQEQPGGDFVGIA